MTMIANNDKKANSIQNIGTASNEAVVSATSDIIVKSFETYVLLLNLLRKQSFEIFTGLVKIFEFYIYAVNTSFVEKRALQKLFSDAIIDNLQHYKDEDDRLKALENAHDLVMFQAENKKIRTFLARLIDQFETYNLKLQIQNNEEENQTSDILVNLGERIIATESIFFVYNHLKLIQLKLPKLVQDSSQLQTITEYYESYSVVIPKLREFIYFHYMPDVLKRNNVFQAVEHIKWEIQGQQEFSNIYIGFYLI